jgi:hypothetical protein
MNDRNGFAAVYARIRGCKPKPSKILTPVDPGPRLPILAVKLVPPADFPENDAW